MQILADKYGSIEHMKDWIEGSKECNTSDIVEEQLKKINGIGPVAAKTIMSDEFWDAVNALYELVTIAPYEKEEKPTGDFAGKVFVLTGKMAHPRSYYVELIEKAGGKEGSAVNSKTNYLVIQDAENSQSSKAKKARELGTKLISPEQLEEMLR
jgi:DNA ligase (NAD+)